MKNHANEIVGGDKNRILSIGSNLLSNAIKFTKNGSVTLTTEYTSGIFTLSVSDTGTGMTKEQQLRIFVPFERLGNSVTEDGFGLGLAIVSDTVKLLNGSITVKSKPGKGSRFTVSLPLPKAEETMATEKTTVKHSTLSGYSVLAIDNNGMLLDMMKEMYRQSGVKCDTCQSVDELTDRMRTKDYDLLVTDLKMPEVNGYEVLELLRTSEIGNSQTIPVVAATAAGYVEEKELTEKGFAAVLYKPYSIDELLAVTERCIKPKGTSNIDLSPLLAFGDKRRTLEKLAATTQSDMDDYIPKPLIEANLFPLLKTLQKRTERHDTPIYERQSAAFREIDRRIRLVAPTNMNVLILGESGTGKEHIAGKIHARSKRAGKPFVAVDCGLLSKELAASALFGHEKGAFTGAESKKQGFWEEAAGGTLFLDEIGNLPIEVQQMLLRALESKMYRPTGGSKDKRADVRIIAATNENLQVAITEKRFRADLYQRLKEYTLHIPPLRECKEDIIQLAEFFLQLADAVCVHC